MSITTSLRRKAVVWSVVGVVVLVFSGCSTLKRKFTRKKKSHRQKEVESVLEPIDYPAASVSVSQTYAYHFSMVAVWLKELATEVEERQSDKKVRYLVRKVEEHLEEMGRILPSGHHESFEGVKKKVRAVRQRLDQPAALRSSYQILRQLSLIEKELKRRLKPSLVFPEESS